MLVQNGISTRISSRFARDVPDRGEHIGDRIAEQQRQERHDHRDPQRDQKDVDIGIHRHREAEKVLMPPHLVSLSKLSNPQSGIVERARQHRRDGIAVKDEQKDHRRCQQQQIAQLHAPLQPRECASPAPIAAVVTVDTDMNRSAVTSHSSI